MRFAFVSLLATAAALVVSGDTYSAAMIANPAQDVPAMAPNGVTRSLETGNGADTNKRFLRNDRDAGEDDDIDNSSDNNDADEEERANGKNLFAEWKLNEMQSSVKTFKRFKNWKAYGLSPGTVATRLENKGIYEKYKDLYQMYQKYYTTI